VKLLVLGGTRFVGRAIVTAAIEASHDVTLFHRGQTNAELFPESEHLHGDRDGGLAALEGRSWDACIDVSGYLPRVVRQSAELLAGAVGTYVFVSTISVFADLAVPRDESGPLATLDGETEDITEGSYGALKALCERVVTDTYAGRSAVVRPGFVVGPHDHTGRFTWWVHRAARGGVIPVPESIAARIQVIDARDLGAFVVRAATEPLRGVFNATGPVPPVSMTDVVEAAAAEAGVELSVEVVPDAVATALGLGFEDLPLWIDDPEWVAWAEVDVSRAIGAGLRFRPLADTVSAALHGAATVEGWGLSEERERELLAAATGG
jgi:nucleoside-diphosphate-sugar epimerase